jgi:plasmid stabilization system protein ParE
MIAHILSEDADLDLDHIWEYIAPNNVSQYRRR